MADEDHLRMLHRGGAEWNEWRHSNPNLQPDLSGADLGGAYLDDMNLSEVNLSEADLGEAHLIKADLSGANLVRANLCEAYLDRAHLDQATLFGANLLGACLNEAYLHKANLAGANLSETFLHRANLFQADLGGASLVEARLQEANLSLADLSGANLVRADFILANLSAANLTRANLSEASLVWAKLLQADLSGANLFEAHLSGADLSGANLTGADVRSADLARAIMVGTNLTSTDLTGCLIYGISAWDLNLEGATQQDLVITPHSEPTITVDNIEVGQFIYLLLNNEKIRSVVDTITSKVVLILGRFTADRKAVLDALRDELRRRDYLPVLFDFDSPSSRDITETVSLLARMARFVVADITDARSIPQELGVIVPDLPSVPVQPLLLEGADEYGMFEHFKQYPWVLGTYRYTSPEALIASLAERVIEPAQAKVLELQQRI